MGREWVGLEANGFVSDHNSEQDIIDRRAWHRFVAEVKRLAERPEFEDLEIMVSGDDGDG